jgi:N-acetylglucosamine-6-phosphate deacetylase
VAATHAAGGTTSFMPTTVAAPLAAIEAVLDAHRAFVARPPSGARSIGVHLEGPYLAPSQAGALDPRFMRVPEGDAGLRLLTPEAGVRRMTAAPELPGGMALGQRLRALGAIAAIGHSAVRGDGLLEALEHGYTLLTHFYSGWRA